MDEGWGFARRLAYELGIDEVLAEYIKEFVDTSSDYVTAEHLHSVEDTMQEEIHRLGEKIDMALEALR